MRGGEGGVASMLTLRRLGLCDPSTLSSGGSSATAGGTERQTTVGDLAAAAPSSNVGGKNVR
eukprot:5281959-Pyramimonas_sp.AAC.2